MVQRLHTTPHSVNDPMRIQAVSPRCRVPSLDASATYIGDIRLNRWAESPLDSRPLGRGQLRSHR